MAVGQGVGHFPNTSPICILASGGQDAWIKPFAVAKLRPAPSRAGPVKGRGLFRDHARATLGTCGGAHFLHDGFSDALYLLMPIWAEAFGLSMAQVGLLKTVYSGTMAAFQVPAGLLSERHGERILLWGGTALAGLAYIVMGATDGFAMLVVVLMAAGLASSVQHPLSSALVVRAYAEGPRRAALGIYNFTGDLGKVAVPATIGVLVVAIGWRGATVTYGALGVLAAFAIFVALKRLEMGGVATRAASSVAAGGWGIHNKGGFAALSGIGMIDSAARYGFLTFLPFLLVQRCVGVETVGFALALTFAGGAAGKLLCGLMAERVGVIRTAALTELLTGAGILVLPLLPLTIILALLPILGVALNGTSSVLYGTVADFVDDSRQSRAFGLFYTLGIGAGALSPVAFGLLGDAAGVPAALTGLGVLALLTLPLCYALRRAMPSKLT